MTFWHEPVSAKEHFALKSAFLKVANSKSKYTLPLQRKMNSNSVKTAFLLEPAMEKESELLQLRKT